MISRLSLLIAALVACAALAGDAPAAGLLEPSPAGAVPVAGGLVGPCASATGAEVQGRPGGVQSQVCGGLAFIGPAIGQIDTTIGPTIISPAVTGANIVTGNNIAIGP